MHKVALVLACLPYLGYGRRAQKPFKERDASESLEVSTGTSAFNPAFTGARLPTPDIRGPPRIAERSGIRSTRAMEVNPASDMSEAERRAYMDAMVNGVRGGGEHMTDAYLATTISIHEAIQRENNVSFQLSCLYSNIKSYEQDNIPHPRPESYEKMEELKAELGPEQTQRVIDEVDARFAARLIENREREARRVEEERIEREGGSLSQPLKIEQPLPIVAAPQAPPTVQSGLVTGTSYAAMMQSQAALPARTPAAPTQQSAAPATPAPMPATPIESAPSPAPETRNEGTTPQIPDKDPMELRQQYSAYLQKSLADGRELYTSVVDMITLLAKEKPPSAKEHELIKEIVDREQQLGLEIHLPFLDALKTPLAPAPLPAPPPPAPQPIVDETTYQDQPVTSLPSDPQQLLPSSGPTTPAAAPEQNPVKLRQQYKSYLEKCTQDGRQPQGAILELIAQLAKEQPPSALEAADLEEIIRMEERFGLTIHAPSKQPEESLPPAQQAEPISASPAQNLASPSGAVEPTDEPLMMGTAADIVASMAPAAAAVPVPESAPQSSAVMRQPSEAPAANTAEASAIARDALEQLMRASDLSKHSQADSEALLSSLVRALAAVQAEVLGDGESPAGQPASQVEEDPPATFFPGSPAAPPASLSAPVPAPAPAAFLPGEPLDAKDQGHKGTVYYVSGMEQMNVAQYKNALQKKRQAKMR